MKKIQAPHIVLRMSNYKAHTQFNLFFALPLSSAALFWSLSPAPWLLSTYVASFAYGSLFMSPDMDLAYKIKPFSLRGFFSIPFLSYSMFFRHRGLSHSLLLGTFTRLLWLLFFIFGLIYSIWHVVPNPQSLSYLFMKYQDYCIWGIGGLFAADVFHLMLDKRL